VQEREREANSTILKSFGFSPTSSPQEHLLRIPKSTNQVFLTSEDKTLQSCLNGQEKPPIVAQATLNENFFHSLKISQSLTFNSRKIYC
jgi:hypothetical protein